MNRISDAEATLARWHEEAAAVRSRRGGIGVARPEQVEGLSGMQVFEAMLAGRLPAPPIGQTLDFELVQVEPGMAVFQGRPGPAHYNPMGTVHGGWFATLLDSAVGCAVHSTLPAGKAYTTLELKINIVRALSERVPLVRAEGRVVHGGSQVATAEGRLVGPDGKLYAHASTTCLVFDARR
ncbi:PaaI family thioesterase [Piscinibacter sp.]|uniref:PaaI family thioesterase n=1 Tax=Piscinibacter sp. TaxID=1903157 RepID=UPI001B5F2014|nr:PaaI family thioesterase [Piscinibacter sp.]MBP5992181.1 PaaI family thioesterase [Piscinibacter sp.]MBP6029257.1 PaaI family thioesterase [Piscinibacter sp.]